MATILQSCLAVVNGFFEDHGVAPIAEDDLVGKVKRGIAASQVSLQPIKTRMYLLARILVSSLRTYARG
jgi:hypothetical protein